MDPPHIINAIFDITIDSHLDMGVEMMLQSKATNDGDNPAETAPGTQPPVKNPTAVSAWRE
jgi:hypothetical protein